MKLYVRGKNELVFVVCKFHILENQYFNDNIFVNGVCLFKW